MGIFDFVKNAGAKILGRDEEEEVAPAAPEVNHFQEKMAEEAVQQQKEELEAKMASRLTNVVWDFGVNVQDLDITVSDDVATVYGVVTNQSDLEKIVLLIGNHEGIAQVDAQIDVEVPEPEATFYTVVKGDSLSKIAKAQYGNASRYPEIFEANKPMLSHPDKIYPGQVLRIPADENANV